MASDGELLNNIPELPPAPPRESLIATAVKFLQNPKVNDSPLPQKKQFLIRKGLTDEEVDIAILRAGPSAGENALALTTQMPYDAPPMQSVSTWTRIREYSTLAIIIGGVVYGIYTLYKRFIEPIFKKSVKIQEEKLQHMEEGVKNISNGLKQNMQEIRTTMNELQDQIAAQNQKLSQVAANLTSYKTDSTYSNVSNSAIGELKAEITSVKGLLLSRNQFPTQPLMKPAIPSWQLKPPLASSSSSTSGQEPETTAKENITEGEKETDFNGNGTENGDEASGDFYGKTENLNGFASGDSDTHTDADPGVTSES